MANRKQTKRSGLALGATQEPSQPSPNEQSGSGGRNTEAGKLDQTKDTGQDRYGQSGYAGVVNSETPGKANNTKSGSEDMRKPEHDSNVGSGRADHESEEYSGEGRAANPKKRNQP